MCNVLHLIIFPLKELNNLYIFTCKTVALSAPTCLSSSIQVEVSVAHHKDAQFWCSFFSWGCLTCALVVESLPCITRQFGTGGASQPFHSLRSVWWRVRRINTVNCSNLKANYPALILTRVALVDYFQLFATHFAFPTDLADPDLLWSSVLAKMETPPSATFAFLHICLIRYQETWPHI